MDFYFTDRKFNLIEIASTDGQAPYQLSAAPDFQSVKAAARTLSGTLIFTREQANRINQMAALGNYVLYHDKFGKDRFMTIMDIRHDPLNGTHDFTAEDAGVDLINETVGAYTADKAYNIAYYINKFTYDSGFEIGTNEISTLSRKLKWDSTDETSLARILSVATQFDAELDFSFEISGTNVVKRYINIYKRRGADNQVRLYLDKDINNIVTTGDIYDLYTSVYATGGTPEGSDKPITLKGYKWTDPDGRYELGADGILRDTVAVQLWSRILSNDNPNPTKHHLQRSKSYEASTQASLLQSALGGLKKAINPAVNYEVDIAVLPENIEIGDTVHIVDDNEDLYLSARVLELKYDYALEQYTATLGDYLIEVSTVDEKLKELADNLKEMPKAIQYYPWVRYADDASGAGFSAFPTGKAYMAIVFGKVSTPSDNPSDYAGKWIKILGPDGSDGLAGPAGEDGQTSYFHRAYANSLDGKTDFSVTDGNGKSYMGTYSDFIKADSTDPTKYNWALFKGPQGVKGDPGANGSKGPAGADGKSSYLHTAYAQSADGKTGFSTTDATDATYIGVYSDQTEADSTDPTEYTWVKAQGPAGVDGAQGTPGKAGADGKTSYVHTAWAWSPDGSDRFMTSYPAVNYVLNSAVGPDMLANNRWNDSYALLSDGIRGLTGEFEVGFDVTLSEDVTDEQSIEITLQTKGGGLSIFTIFPFRRISLTPGVTTHLTRVFTGDYTAFTGNGGRMVAKFGNAPTVTMHLDNMYIKRSQESNTWTPAPSDDYQAAYPTYRGEYTDFTQADSENPSDYTWVRVLGQSGEDGLPGKDGKGIKSSVIDYQLGTSGTDAPTGTWSTTVPTLTKGQYLWTRTTLTYTDNTSEPVYSVTYIAKDGNNGTDGVAGKDGVGIKSTTITYATSSSGTITPTSGWVSNPPAVNPGQFMWTKTVWNYTDNSSETGYSVAQAGKTGATGPAGKDGIAGKDGVGLKSTAVTYQLGSSGTTKPTGTWSATVPTLTKGQYLWTKTTWTYSDNTTEDGFSVSYIAKDGSSGSDGLPGKDGTGIKSTVIDYAVSSSGVTKPTTGWSASIPDVAAGQFMWTRTTWSYTDGTNETGYSVAKAGETGPAGKDGTQGIPGPVGPNGKNSQFHQAWADSSDGKTGFSTTISLGKKYLGTYTDYVEADSTDPTKYKWVELVGAVEIGGRNYMQDSATPVKVGIDWGTDRYIILPTYLSSAVGKYTFSAKLSDLADNTSGKISVGMCVPNNANISYGTYDVPIVNSTLTAYFDVPADMSDRTYIYIYGNSGVWDGSATGHHTISEYKLEIGNKPSDWSPAPEDIDKAIDDANKHVDDAINNLIPPPSSGISYPSNPKKGQQHWLTDANGKPKGLFQYDGSKWVAVPVNADTISANTLNGMTINGVTINGSTINSPNINVPFNNVPANPDEPEGSPFATFVSGTTKLTSNLNISGNITDGTNKTPQWVKTLVSPQGFSNIISTPDASKALSVVEISLGAMFLSEWHSDVTANDGFVSSYLKAGDATTYEYVDTLAANNNINNGTVRYMRKGSQVNVGFRFNLKNDTGWVALGKIRAGYTPASLPSVGVNCPSLSYQGYSCVVYPNNDGWRLIPNKGQGIGTFQGTVSYVTYDDYPYNDAVH